MFTRSKNTFPSKSNEVQDPVSNHGFSDVHCVLDWISVFHFHSVINFKELFKESRYTPGVYRRCTLDNITRTTRTDKSAAVSADLGK